MKDTKNKIKIFECKTNQNMKFSEAWRLLSIWSNHLINGTGFLFLGPSLLMGSSASPYWEVIQEGVGSISNTSVVNIIARVERKERLHARLYTCVFFFSFSSGMHYMLVIIRENKKKKKKRKRWKLICGQEGISIYIAEDRGSLFVRPPAPVSS